MASNARDAYQGTESVESTDGPRVFDSPTQYHATRRIDYGDLVARVMSELDMNAADAKQHIAREGRAAVLTELSE